ncbi:hypothetical protein F5Y06DRAFT_299666 [Hypoxylon sp. FL0890]|nr:hypothetical protein F5Y06DRAFT_299666 [Hypoxylon sp. FL0890]
MSAKGIVGLRFYIRGFPGSTIVSAGDMELRDPDSGISRLTPGERMQCIGFYIGLDACKIISISLVDQQTGTLPDALNKDSSPNISQYVQPAEVWNPNIPEIHPVWHFPEPRRTQFFNLCLNMDFGGRDGQLLQSRIRIVMFTGGFLSVFLGISFIYMDGSERFYGPKSFRNSLKEITSTPAIRLYFVIDSPHGEVMNRLSVSYSQKMDTIQAITV